LAERVAHGAELHEIGLTGEVEAARLDRRRRRHEECPQPDTIARLERRRPAPRADANRRGGGRRIEPRDRRGAQQQTLAAHPLLDQQDLRRLDLVGAALAEHGSRDQMGAQIRHRKAEQDRAEADRQDCRARSRGTGQAVSAGGPGEHGRQQRRRGAP
jgi:hypothetical protein